MRPNRDRFELGIASDLIPKINGNWIEFTDEERSGIMRLSLESSVDLRDPWTPRPPVAWGEREFRWEMQEKPSVIFGRLRVGWP